MSSHLIRQQQEEIKGLRDAMRAEQHTSKQLRDLIEKGNNVLPEHKFAEAERKRRDAAIRDAALEEAAKHCRDSNYPDGIDLADEIEELKSPPASV